MVRILLLESETTRELPSSKKSRGAVDTYRLPLTLILAPGPNIIPFGLRRKRSALDIDDLKVPSINVVLGPVIRATTFCTLAGPLNVADSVALILNS